MALMTSEPLDEHLGIGYVLHVRDEKLLSRSPSDWPHAVRNAHADRAAVEETRQVLL